MRRIQTQSKGLMGKDFNAVPDVAAIKTQRPTEFTSLLEARSGLEVVMNQLTIFFTDLELDDQFYNTAVSDAEKRFLFGPWLESWEMAFTAFLHHHRNTLSQSDRRAAMVLKAHHLVYNLYFICNSFVSGVC